MLPRLLLPTTPNYHANQSKCKQGEVSCAICGKGVDVSKPGIRYVYTVDGSDVCSKQDMDENDGWEMPVGPDCWKKHPEIHEYASC